MPPIRPIPSVCALLLPLVLAACGVRSDETLTDDALLGEGTVANGATIAGAPADAKSAADRALGERRATTSAPSAISAPNGSATERDCSGSVRTGAEWVERMPATFPLYPGSTLVEAGGTTAACGLRVLSFRSGRPPAAVLDWYAVRARQAGYTAERDRDGADRRLGGTRGNDAFVLFVQASGDGSQAQLVANAGR